MSTCSCSVWKEIYKVLKDITGWIHHCHYHMKSPQDQSLEQSIIVISMEIWPEERGLKRGTSRGRLWAPCRTWWRWPGGPRCCPWCASVAVWWWETRWWSWTFGYWCSTIEELQWPGISRLTFEVVKIPGNPEVLLKWSRQWRKDGLGGLVAVKGGGGPWVVTIFTIVSMLWWCGRRWCCYHDLSMWGNIDDGHANFLMQRI